MSRPKKNLAFAASLCLFAATLEMLIPKPLPFLRLGLANLPLMLFLPHLSFSEFAAVSFLKFLTSALVSGTILSPTALLSLAATAAGGTAMYLAYKTHLFSYYGISLLGALFSNLAQILAAGLVLFGNAVIYIAPPIIALGIATSLVLAELARRLEGEITPALQAALTGEINLPEGEGTSVKLPKFPLKRTLILFVSVIIANLLDPFGRVLFSIGAFDITAGALRSGIEKCLAVLVLTIVSRLILRSKKLSETTVGGMFAYFTLISDKWREAGKNPLGKRVCITLGNCIK